MRELTRSEFYTFLNQETVTLTEDIKISSNVLSQTLQLINPFKNTSIDSFSGELDGNGYTIHNLPKQLFERITENGVIKNITINFDEDSLQSPVLAKYNNGLIKNVTVQSKSQHTTEAGLVLENKGVLQNCTYKGELFLCSSVCGGLVKQNFGTVLDCLVEESKVSQDANSRYDSLGGIVGQNTGKIRLSRVSEVDFCEVHGCGGIVGDNRGGIISECQSDNLKTKNRSEQKKIGGIAGVNSEGGSIQNCSVKDSVLTGRLLIGGIVGLNENLIRECESTESDLRAEEGYVGGICGRSNRGDISKCYSSTTIISSMSVGGIVGSLEDASLTKSVSNDCITVEGDKFNVGCLIGATERDFEIKNCYSISHDNFQLIGDFSPDVELRNNSNVLNVKNTPRLSKKEAVGLTLF